MDAWQGSPVGAATTAWGDPDVRRSEAGQTLWIWYDYSGAGSPTLLCERVLAVDSMGVIRGWRWRGDACPALADERSGRVVATRR